MNIKHLCPASGMRWLIAVLIVACILLSGCGNQLSGQVQSDIPTQQISITSGKFDPLVVYVKPGTMVTWTNKDSESHTVTLLGMFDSGTLGRRHSYSYVFEKEGSYTYTDLFNQNEIVGKVVVQ